MRDLDVPRESNETLVWYQWTAVLLYQPRFLETPTVPSDQGFVWEPSGSG